MQARAIAIGSLVGGATVIAAGYVIFALPLGNFYAYAMSAGSASGVMRATPVFWAVLLACLAQGALITLAIVGRGDSITAGRGIQAGAVVAFLMWFSADFMLYAISNVGTLLSALLDPIVETAIGSIAGAAIGAALGRFGAIVHPPRVAHA